MRCRYIHEGRLFWKVDWLCFFCYWIDYYLCGGREKWALNRMNCRLEGDWIVFWKASLFFSDCTDLIIPSALTTFVWIEIAPVVFVVQFWTWKSGLESSFLIGRFQLMQASIYKNAAHLKKRLLALRWFYYLEWSSSQDHFLVFHMLLEIHLHWYSYSAMQYNPVYRKTTLEAFNFFFFAVQAGVARLFGNEMICFILLWTIANTRKQDWILQGGNDFSLLRCGAAILVIVNAASSPY